MPEKCSYRRFAGRVSAGLRIRNPRIQLEWPVRPRADLPDPVEDLGWLHQEHSASSQPTRFGHRDGQRGSARAGHRRQENRLPESEASAKAIAAFESMSHASASQSDAVGM
jgi:hypothetical protein